MSNWNPNPPRIPRRLHGAPAVLGVLDREFGGQALRSQLSKILKILRHQKWENRKPLFALAHCLFERSRQWAFGGQLDFPQLQFVSLTMMLEARGTKWWVVNDDLPTCHACQVANDREVCQWMVATFKSTSLFASFARRGRLKWRQTDETLYQALKFLFPPTAWVFGCFLQKGFWMSGCCEESWKCNVDENWRLDSRWHFFKLWFNSPAVKAARWTSLGTYSQLHRALHKVGAACYTILFEPLLVRGQA